MSISVDRSLLNGVSFETASLYGMPHYGAYYAGNGINTNKLYPSTLCACCRRLATNSHHEPPKGKGHAFVLHGHVLKPALIALCGSGTTGCHGRRHSGKLRIRWAWKNETYERLWWDGTFLRSGFVSNDPRLYRYGKWVFECQK